jgi:DNA-binding LytR/AlgR family response regulator
MTQTVRVAIAEDDRSQAERLLTMVKTLEPSWSVVATPTDVPSLREAIDNAMPHVLMLDIHMPDSEPGTTGVPGVMGLLRGLPYQPAVILITGDPTLAPEAFELAVTDYLVKPITTVRLEQAISRAREFVAASFKVLNDAHVQQPRKPGWLRASRGTDAVIVSPEDVVYLQAERKYTRLLLRTGDEALLRLGISEAARLLDPQNFVRVHRSTIVNMRDIALVRRDEMGRLRLHLSGRKDRLIVSKPFERQFRAL